eukprot:2101876-Pyramimonas_sp.AAC.1
MRVGAGELGQESWGQRGVARVGARVWGQSGGRVGTKSRDKTVRTGELGPESWDRRVRTGELGPERSCESWGQKLGPERRESRGHRVGRGGARSW